MEADIASSQTVSLRLFALKQGSGCKGEMVVRLASVIAQQSGHYGPWQKHFNASPNVSSALFCMGRE